ncbi:MAG: electron transfer flavoprotein subunit beta/FixA family protein [Nitrospirae bacterium]|nr:electron transfer flavoprotein subunit beta/FixA family protein [Nitrospirota bacterium]
MRIIVFVKQVPDTAEVKINPETNTLVREGVPSIINPYDVHALEAALQIRDHKGGKVIVVTMGPPQAEDALREAVSMGADEVFLVSDRAFAGADTWATSYALYRAAEKIGFDIILCGKQAIDGDTAQVGPETAEFLNIPHISYIRKIEDVSESSIKVQRLMDDGYDIVESSLPLLMTVVKEINTPRLPSLKGKMAAKKAVINKLDLEALGGKEIEANVGLKGSPTQVRNIFAPKCQVQKRELSGTPEEQVAALVQDLRRIRCA